METDVKGVLGDPQASGEEIRRAWEFAALAAMQGHRKAGEPVVTWDWDTQQAVLTDPDEFVDLGGTQSVEKSVHVVND